jgi:two-component system phosphate regulon response regulator PhoB
VTRILVVEDEEDLAQLLVYNLRAEGFEVEVAGSGASALAKTKALRPALILLDVMLPDIPGTEVARLVRVDPELASTAILMVTAKGQEQDRIKGLELGADDYVVKPFSVKELLLRVKAVLRRVADAAAPAEGEVLSAGEIRLDVGRHEVLVSGKPVPLTALEFRLLQTLLDRPGRVQTREILLADVWGIQAEVTTRTVDTHIKRLREKLGPAADIIETIRGVGYKLDRPPKT